MKKPDGIIVSTQQVGAFFGVTPRAVQLWVKTGCPKHRHGKYDLQKVFHWWIDNVYKTVAEDGDDSLKEAKRQFWWARAKREDLKAEQEKGSLLPKHEVEKAAFECARHVRDSILQIPDRIGAILAAERDEFKVKQELLKELRQALERLADGE